MEIGTDCTQLAERQPLSISARHPCLLVKENEGKDFKPQYQCSHFYKYFEGVLCMSTTLQILFATIFLQEIHIEFLSV